MEQIENEISQDIFDYECIAKEIQDSLVNKNCLLMIIQNNDEPIEDEDYNNWFDKVFYK